MRKAKIEQEADGIEERFNAHTFSKYYHNTNNGVSGFSRQRVEPGYNKFIDFPTTKSAYTDIGRPVRKAPKKKKKALSTAEAAAQLHAKRERDANLKLQGYAKGPSDSERIVLAMTDPLQNFARLQQALKRPPT
jgi:hypothetical protein